MAQIDHAKRIHLIGIGGCSMNGLALILQSQGHKVSGSLPTHSTPPGSPIRSGIRANICGTRIL